MPERPARLPRLVLFAVRLAWTASRRELLLVAGLQLLQGAVLAGLLLAVGTALSRVLGAAAVTDALPAVGLLVLLQAASGVVGALVAERNQLFGELVAQHVQRRVLDVAAAMDYPAFETPVLYDRLERATTGTGGSALQVVLALVSLSGTALTAAGATVALLVLHPLLVPLVLLAAVPAVLASSRAGRSYADFVFGFTPAERERSYLSTLLTRRAAAKEVRVLALAGHLLGRWDRLTAERLRMLRRVVRRQLLLSAGGQVGSAALLGAALLMLVWLVTTGRLTAAEAGAAGVALAVLGQRVQGLGASAGMLLEAAPFVRDLEGLFALGARTRAAAPTAAAPESFAEIAVEDVTFTHPSGDRPALREVSLTLRAGEVVALVGENGSGKTTLASLLCGLHRPDSGRIRWDGVDTATLDPASLRSRVAVLFQDFQRFLLTARDNIGFGRVERLDDLAGIRRAAADAGAAELVERLPAGYDTLLGVEFAGGTDLSGGQWQRVGLARSFFRDAPLVILDEPTAALDPRAERALFDTVRKLFRGRTVLLVSHRYPSVRSADRIVVLHEGRVVESGDHRTLLAAGGRYAELYAIQAELYAG